MTRKTMSAKLSKAASSGRFTSEQSRKRLTASIVGSLRVEGYTVTTKAVEQQISELRKKK